jgi:uncharacterized protein YkvS
MDRETYVKGNLHHVGDVVEIPEGIGEIEVLGANYVIVKTAMGDKYRKWVSDIKSVVNESEIILSKKLNTPMKSISKQNMTSF